LQTLPKSRANAKTPNPQIRGLKALRCSGLLSDYLHRLALQTIENRVRPSERIGQFMN
jgi:hypothetical protein